MVETVTTDKRTLLSLLESLLSWSDANKVLLTSVTYLSFEVCLLVGHYVLIGAESTKFISAEFAPLDLRVRLTSVTIWVMFSAFAFSRRGRDGADPLLTYMFAVIAAVTILYNAWIGGTHTQIYVSAAALGSLSIGALLFNRSFMISCVILFLAGFFALTILQQTGMIPYAPLLVSAPFSEGVLSGTWLLTHALIGTTIMIFAACVTIFITHLWHEREEQLANANELISRYVASQVAAEIKAGHYDLIERQRREKLTLFFSDIKEFSNIADMVEPEDLALILNEYLAEMTRIGHGYGATIDKFVGDAIMIFFGAPKASTNQDNALRTVRMAIDMQLRMIELAQKWRDDGFEHPFQIRIGINTGQVSLGNFGSPERMDYTAIGRQVNLAARLEAQCKPGKILISHSTWLLVKNEIATRALGEINLKGFTLPVKVYEVVQPRTPTAP